jgi:effector-binding domain-containing protein
MPKMHIDKSIEISAPVDKVYETISDFHHWKPWSPWLIMNPNADLDIDEDGKAYSWNGDLVGSGEMKISSESKPERVDMDLTFLTPWNSHAKVWFVLKSSGDATMVSWYMDSSLPFFMFWMKKMMTVLVGMDYDRGLNMLKDFIETGSVPTKLEKNPNGSYAGCTYVGITTDCTIAEIGPSMEKDFQSLFDWMKENGIEPSGLLFSQYHKWQLTKGRATYTAGIPVSSLPDSLPAGFRSGVLPSTKVYQIKHTGPYKHLGNAWMLGQTLMRNKVFKGSKKIHPFETYENDPASSPENELITNINFPLR